MSVIYGTTRIGFLLKGKKAIYFGRGAVQKLTFKPEKEDEKPVMKFSLLADQKHLASSDENGVIDFSKATSLKTRKESFARTKLPYKENEVTPEVGYINLSAYEKLELEFEDLPKFCDGYIDQVWSQLLNEKDDQPLIRYAFNLVNEPEYIPPQIRSKQTTTSTSVEVK